MSKIILVKHAGHIIPKVMVEKVLGAHQSFLGTVQVVGDKMNIEHFPKDEMPTVDEFMMAQEQDKDILTGMFLGQATAPILGEDYQPFPVLHNKDNDLLVSAMVEGNYPNDEHKDSQFSGEFHMVNDILVPTLHDLWENCGGELPKLVEKLQLPLFKRTIDNAAMGRGVVVLFTKSGEVLKFQKGNMLDGTFSEFWTSNKLGYEEKSSKDVKPEEKPARVGFGKRLATAIANTVPITQTKKEPPVIVNQEIKPEKTSTAITAPRPKIKPNPDIVKQKGNKLRGFYENNCVSVPDNWRDGPEHEANDSWIARNSKNLQKYRAFNEAMDDVKKTMDTLPEKKESPNVLPTNVKEQIKSLIQSDQVKAIIEGEKVVDVKSLKAQDIPTFSEQTGIAIEDVIKKYDVEVLHLLIKKDARAGALLARELADNLKMLLLGSNSDTKAEESISSEAEKPKTEARKGFGRRMAA